MNDKWEARWRATAIASKIARTFPPTTWATEIAAAEAGGEAVDKEYLRDQYRLWQQRARRTDPETSKRAAAKASRFAGDHKTRILSALAQGPMTAAEIGSVTGLTVVQIDRRMIELARARQTIPTKRIRGGMREWRIGSPREAD